jgi:hypothetical protein
MTIEKKNVEILYFDFFQTYAVFVFSIKTYMDPIRIHREDWDSDQDSPLPNLERIYNWKKLNIFL